MIASLAAWGFVFIVGSFAAPTDGGALRHSAPSRLKRQRADDAPPSILIRKGPLNETITVEYPLGTNITENPHTGDIRLEFGSSEQQPPQYWEQMIIRPRLLNVSVANSDGTINFQNGEEVHIDSRDEHLSGSPFKERFGRFSLGNESLEVRFPDVNGEIYLRSARGDTIWVRPGTNSATITNAAGTQIALTQGKVIEATDAHGERQLRVDLLAKTVDMSKATEGSRAVECGGTQREWNASAAWVSARDACDTTNQTTWSATAADVGTLKISGQPIMHMNLHSADDGARATVYRPAHYLLAGVGACSLRLDRVMTEDGLSEAFGHIYTHEHTVTLFTKVFVLNGSPGSVNISENHAVIAGRRIKLTISPFELK